MIKKILPLSIFVLVFVLILLFGLQRMLSGVGSQKSVSVLPTLVPGRQGSVYINPQTGKAYTPSGTVAGSITPITSQELKAKLPLVAPDFSLQYSDRMERYVVTLTTDDAVSSYNDWLAQNPSYAEELKGAIITKQTIAELHAALDYAKKNEMTPVEKANTDAKEFTKSINLLINLPFLFMGGGQGNSPTGGPTPKASIPTSFPQISIAPSSLLPSSPGNLSSKALSFKPYIDRCLVNRAVYDAASAQTGVAWEVLAAIHYNEGGCGQNKSLVSGRTIGENEPDIMRAGGCTSKISGPGVPFPLPSGGCGFSTLLDSALYAANHIKGKIGKSPSNFQELAKAFSKYSGGGNSNCGKTPYSSCPRLFEGEDDAYVMNMFDAKHESMYLVYCADLTRCNPINLHGRPGVATIIRLITNQL